MRVGKSFEFKALDKIAIEEFGFSGLALMETAARSVFKEALEFWPELAAPGRTAILIGPGQNGGDGWVLARLFMALGHQVTAFFAAGKNRQPQGDALANYRLALKLKVPVTPITTAAQAGKISLENFDLLIDALFGTGLDRPLEEPYRALLEKAAQAKRRRPLKTLAVDLPSFVSGDDGRLLGPPVPMDLTVTLAAAKVGLYLGQGPDFCGRIKVGDIGLTPQVWEKKKPTGTLLTAGLAKSLLPPRPSGGHKGVFGHALVLGGSQGFTGALALAANGAARSGAGLVTALCPSSLSQIMEAKLMEAMSRGLAEEEGLPGRFGPQSLAELLSFMENKKALAVGPGLGLNPGAEKLVLGLAEKTFLPTVFDADALTLLAGRLKILKKNKKPKILTPHPGEMARLLNVSVAQVEEERLEAALRLAGESGAVAILKGRHTIVAAPNGSYFINATGGPHMAVGGSGDVLCGLCAGLLAQMEDPLAAALLAVWAHGRAADLAAGQKGPFGLAPQMFAEALPLVWRELSEA